MSDLVDLLLNLGFAGGIAAILIWQMMQDRRRLIMRIERIEAERLEDAEERHRLDHELAERATRALEQSTQCTIVATHVLQRLADSCPHCSGSYRVVGDSRD